MRFPLLDGFLTMVWFFLWILWVILMVIARGTRMHERRVAEAQEQEHAVRSFVKDAATSPASDNGAGTAADLSKLADLRTKDLLSEAEFQQGKAKVLASSHS